MTKLVVLHEQYRELQLNQGFAAYATAAGFRIHAGIGSCRICSEDTVTKVN